MLTRSHDSREQTHSTRDKDMTIKSERGNASRRSVIATLGATATLSIPWVRRVDAAEVLYINTWGGSWEEAAKKHLFAAFTQATGVEIRTVSPISVAKLAAQ